MLLPERVLEKKAWKAMYKKPSAKLSKLSTNLS